MMLPFKIHKPTPVLSENHKNIEGHLEAASFHHIKAVEDLKEGKYEKAAENAILAQKYLDLASKNTIEEQQKNI
jgi:hypothetical protein